MSKYQVTNYGICGECKYHKSDKQDNGFAYIGFYCDNEHSDFYTDFTDYTDTCGMWEQRGIE